MKSAKTKDGRVIEFSLEVDSEGDKNRGWQVDKITATVGGVEAGYIKLSFIPKVRFYEYYPTIFNYADQIGGWHCIPTAKFKTSSVEKDHENYRLSKTRHYKDLSVEELRSLLSRVYLHSHRRCDEQAIASMSRTELLTAVCETEKSLHNDTMGLQFRKFKTRWFNKPIDDFIRTEQNFQRQGIAVNLYKVAEQYCREQNLKMHISKCRQPGSASAKLVEKLRSIGMLKKMSNGREQLRPIV